MSTAPGAHGAAQKDAEAAESRAGVVAVEAQPAELDDVVGLFEATWGSGRSPDRGLLTAAQHAGSSVLVARDAAGRTVGAAFAFVGSAGGIHLHSHMAAVVPELRGRGVGLVLKLRQRSAALAAGIDEIRWTFDPLILRNARFNLVRLGAEVRAFHPDLYGVLGDAINGADSTDRFEVSWRLDSPRVAAALAGHRRPAQGQGTRLLLPEDYERLRARDPAAAARVRAQSRAMIAEQLELGRRPEVDGDAYVFEDPEHSGARRPEEHR